MTRVTMLAVLFLFSAGAVVMSDTATAQEKKDDKKPNGPPKKERESKYDEVVTLKAWDKQRKQFLKAQEGIEAYRKEINKKGLTFALGGRNVIPVTGHPTPMSEITDKDGKVYTVDRVEGKRPYICYVTLKAAEKKPD